MNEMGFMDLSEYADCLQCRCTVDEGVLRRAYRAVWLRRTIVVAVCAVIVVALSFPARWLLNDLIANMVLFLGPGCLLLLLFQPRKRTKRALSRLGADRIEKLVICGDDALLLGEDEIGLQSEFPYDTLKRVYRSKDLRIVQTKAGKFTVLDATRFENGTEADFWALLKDKCPKVRQPKH